MDAAHLHLLVNHFPLIGLVFSLLILALGLWQANQTIIRVGLLVVLVSGALAAPTFLSGEPAEEILEKRPGFSDALIEPHEEAAELTIWLVGATFLSAAGALWLMRGKSSHAKKAIIGTAVLNLITIVSLARTSNLGGQISHPEIRDSANQTTPPSGDDD